VRKLMSRLLGLSAKRPLPHYAHERSDRWFAKRNERATVGPSRGEVILWDDTFVRYHEPHIGVAAVAVLEALGFEVSLLQGRKCCGRPAFSQGNLDQAMRLGQHNLDLLCPGDPDVPVLFLEPSCYSMFVEDYRELNLVDAPKGAQRSFLFEKFVDEILSREPEALRFKESSSDVAIHAHCHAKALMKPGFMATLARRIPGARVNLLETGCCGMAGALDSKYELSLKVAESLVRQIDAQPAHATIVASGTSCRHQIEHLTPVRPKHMAELLAEALQ